MEPIEGWLFWEFRHLNRGAQIAVILQNTLFKSTPKMARTKQTARKGMDGAASRKTKASKNIATKAPHKPPSQWLKCYMLKFRSYSIFIFHSLSCSLGQFFPLCATYTIREWYRTNTSLYDMNTTFIACSYSAEFLLLKLLRA